MATNDAINYFHKHALPWLITQGQVYHASSFIQNLANGTSALRLGRVPTDKRVNFILRSTQHNSTARIEVELFEDVTVTDPGTENTDISNFNRNKPKDNGFRIFSGPTVSGLTNLIEKTIILGTDSVGNRGVISSSIEPLEISRELKRGSDYALRFTNFGETCDIVTLFQWHEEPYNV